MWLVVAVAVVTNMPIPAQGLHSRDWLVVPVRLGLRGFHSRSLPDIPSLYTPHHANKNIFVLVRSFCLHSLWVSHLKTHFACIAGNLNVDNSYFWRDPEHQLHVGVLDWGGASATCVGYKLWWWLSSSELSRPNLLYCSFHHLCHFSPDNRDSRWSPHPVLRPSSVLPESMLCGNNDTSSAWQGNFTLAAVYIAQRFPISSDTP
eukprot:4123646-Amphidinium_carterae.1